MTLADIYIVCDNITPYHAFEIRKGKTREVFPYFHELPVKYTHFSEVELIAIYKELVVVTLKED